MFHQYSMKISLKCLNAFAQQIIKLGGDNSGYVSIIIACRILQNTKLGGDNSGYVSIVIACRILQITKLREIIQIMSPLLLHVESSIDVL